MMLDDYKKAVINFYHRNKEMGKFSLNLSHPTPAKLRDECLIALNSRTQKKDQSFIKEFFNSGTESSDYSHSIRKFDADKFRPLVKFLKNQTEDTEDKNVELLAWLIDFEPRPYKFGGVYNTEDIKPNQESNKTERNKERREEPEKRPEKEFRPVDVNQKPKPLSKKAITLFTMLTLLIGGTYLYIDHSTTAYICDRGSAAKYHLSSKCPALKNCRNSYVQTTIVEAEKNGKTRCGFEQ